MLKDRPKLNYRGVDIPAHATIKEVARSGIMPETALRRMRACGDLPGIQVGNRLYVNVARLLEKLDEQSTTQPTQAARG